ncbi:MAG: PepSY domain-containing protein [Corynebacterium sp.]|uniref:PepSY domain-containing protein n=1 Tax=Corynebacterium TaxID=1716 RepID=UPI0026474275|nr:PepSY domain-containing protein [Corynebacterium sp.]MDN6305552.1 PepSY domain-containing protein [Corynebacterium sp.]MDN6376569.1 PepSY domain-containing protein [Corynebacterium sp.]MDN6396621.1 PepSY domain-containing protein [Corynebacterium sp.]MDN6405274.1 PepSY domain-containing protein [Corynebacterium sp.]
MAAPPETPGAHAAHRWPGTHPHDAAARGDGNGRGRGPGLPHRHRVDLVFGGGGEHRSDALGVELAGACGVDLDPRGCRGVRHQWGRRGGGRTCRTRGARGAQWPRRGRSVQRVRRFRPGPEPRLGRPVAATAVEELRAPVTLTPPASDGEAWTVKENRAAYRLTNDAISVDWATGQVTDRVDFRDWPVAAQLSAWLIQLHMGTLFGLPNQLVLAALAAAIVVMVVWGYTMWFRRRGRNQVLASAPPRASAPGSSWNAGTVTLAVALVAYAAVAPLFGVTCLAFVVLSALWSRFSRSRR